MSLIAMEILVLSTIDIILTRMMNEALFATAVFEDMESALMEYNLHPQEIERFKAITWNRFVSMTLEERRAFAAWVNHPNGSKNPLGMCEKNLAVF